MKAAVVFAAVFALAAVPAADASQLIDRNASGVKLAVNARGEALMTYRTRGRLWHVLAWGAVDARHPTSGKPQVRFKKDYSGRGSLQKTQPVPIAPVVVGRLLPARQRAFGKTIAATRQRAGLLDWVSDVVNAVTDLFSDLANAVGSAIGTVINALLDAGKSLASIVAELVSWTVDRITEAVRALIAAGTNIAAILAEALSRGVLGKFVEALVAAGRSVAEVLSWAVSKAASIVKDAVAALIRAGKTVYDLVVWASGAAASVARIVVQALLDAGRTIAQVMGELVRLNATLIRKMVAAVYAVGQQLAQILVSVAQTSASILRTVLEGLLAVGVTLAQAVATIFADVAAAFRRGFIEGLIALGKAPLEILQAALVAGLSTLGLAFAVVMDIFGGHRPLTAAERAEARKVFGWSIDLDRVKIAVASIPADVANWLNGQRPFTTMYIINFASNAHITIETLIHELTHVWQAATAGPIYMVEALHSQLFGRGYDVTPADIAAANGDIRNLEREQQAVVVERYYQGKWGSGGWDPLVYERLAKCVYSAPPIKVLPVDKLLPFGLPLRRRITGRVPHHAISANE